MLLGIAFVHQRSARVRHVNIRVQADGTVVVTTPLRMARTRLPLLVEEARDWIETERARLKNKPQLWTDTEVSYLGKRYPIVKTLALDGSVKLEEKQITIAPLKHTAQASHELLTLWLKHRAIAYCLSAVTRLSQQMGLTYGTVHFKQQKTRWGSCSSDRNLNFNWRLIHAPPEVIDYVIIHELAHTVHMNHGARFWDLVARYDPDHPLHRGWLKRFGNTED